MNTSNQHPVHPETTQSPQPPSPDRPQDDAPLPIDPEATEREDEVEEASDESFPASDPPSFTRSTTQD
ncbi:MAG TPA: hypothetical protein VM284_03830 [Candidatus Limnocylindria bacterium]|nr:hypothetical protein [Candidatus Limnocylindria bacterium]